ncbi:MAG: hypothetical protein KDE19_04060 [Caldilineaceae bacterium]|nr:hypothetical protein [Caldilineaceae bacterium]
MAIETLWTTLQTFLISIVSAGILWGLAQSIHTIFARSVLTTYATSAPFFQVLVCAGGVNLVARAAGTEVAGGTAVLLTMIWCATVIRETYMRALHHTPLAPDSSESAPHAPSTAPPAKGEVEDRTQPSGLDATDIVSTVSTLVATHMLPSEHFTFRPAPDGAEVASDEQQSARALPLSALSEWIDLTKIPNHPLSKRTPLGKRKIESFWSHER